MRTVDPVSHRIFVSTRAVYSWSFALLLVCGALVAPFFVQHDLHTLYVSRLGRFVALPVLLFGHELLHVIGFRIAGGVARDQISVRFSSRYWFLHVDLRAPVSVGRLRFAALLPGVLLGVVPCAVGAVAGDGKLLVIGALMTVAAGGDLAVVAPYRGFTPKRSSSSTRIGASHERRSLEMAPDRHRDRGGRIRARSRAVVGRGA